MYQKKNALELLNKMIDEAILNQDSEDFKRLCELHKELTKSEELIYYPYAKTNY